MTVDMQFGVQLLQPNHHCVVWLSWRKLTHIESLHKVSCMAVTASAMFRVV